MITGQMFSVHMATYMSGKRNRKRNRRAKAKETDREKVFAAKTLNHAPGKDKGQCREFQIMITGQVKVHHMATLTSNLQVTLEYSDEVEGKLLFSSLLFLFPDMGICWSEHMLAEIFRHVILKEV